MMASCKKPATTSIVCFFSTNKETVDSETEEKKTKDDGDEGVTAKSRYRKKFNAR